MAAAGGGLRHRPQGALAGGAAGWCWHNGDNRAAKDGRPRRSFGLREKRLFAQLDEEEVGALPLLGKVIAEAAKDARAKKPAAGPLRVHPKNPRYFTDGTRNPDGSPRAVYLTGAHTFKRLRARAKAAGERGLYVSVMLFEGWGLMHGNRGRAAPEGWAWRSHPFHPDNNVNGIDPGVAGGLSGEVHRLANKKANDLQAAYVREVVDAVNDLDNVLYEVINEGGQKEWDWWVVKTVQDHEHGKPKQHPVGLTGHGAERLATMLASPADWMSPGRQDGYGEDPPAWDGKKVSLIDTDHVWGVGGDAAWVWKSFLRGHNPLFMDPYDGAVLGKPSDPRWEPVRRALGVTRRFAERVNLAALAPRGELSSTGYCLACPGVEYLVYQPRKGEGFSLELKAGAYRYEWFNPSKGAAAGGGEVESSGGAHKFKVPFEGDAVLYLKAR